MKKMIAMLLALLLSGCGSKTAAPAETGNAIDVDLTVLSSTMVYSEVYNMLTQPDSYVGKTVKMAGGYSAFLDQNTGTVYTVCMIADATACCAQGMEFILQEGLTYPELETDITVIGTFETYREGEAVYCRLVNAQLV